MTPAILLDAGPLTALPNPNDTWHAWARETIRQLPVPFLTSEPVLTEEKTRHRGRFPQSRRGVGSKTSPATARHRPPGCFREIMNPQQARARVAETFPQPFNKAKFLGFTRNLLNKFDESKAA